MQRNLNPKAQAELVEKFLAANGATAQHTQVLELVAHLNGAANWNALERPKKARESAFTSNVKALLQPWAQMFNLEKELSSFQPDEQKRPVESVLRAVFQVAVANQAGRSESEAWRLAALALDTLSSTAREVEQGVRTKQGANRVRPLPDASQCPVYSLQTTMLDDESPWTILLDGEDVDIPYNLLDALLEKAVVAEAVVEFPRADRYGVSTEATHSGCREWLFGQGFALAEDIDISGRDTGDDGMEVCKIAAFVPEELVQRIREAAAQER